MSSEEPTKCSTRSRSFWDETTQLLRDLSTLQDDVANIACPCSKPRCPFRHANGKKDHPWRSRNPPSVITSEVDDYLSSSAQHSVATYLASIQPPHGPVAINSLLRQDCLVTEEPLARYGEVHFVRNSASRKARRRHSTIRISASYPVTMNCLMVPSNLNLSSEQSNSLPDIYNFPLGSSLDSLDSDKMQDIQKSFLRAQQRHIMSEIDLVQL